METVNKKGFQWVEKVCLGMFYVGTLATPSWSKICEFDPHVQKRNIHLLSKTLVSKIDQNNGLFSMELG